VNLRSGQHIDNVVAHEATFRDVVERKAGWRTIDEQLKLPAPGRDSFEAPLISL
jgi:hypothetical protein